MGRFCRFILVFGLLLGLLLPATTTVFAQTSTSEISAALVFSPTKIALRSFSRLTITLSNANGTPLTDAAFTNAFPAGLTISDPANIISTCAGSVTADPGDPAISLIGGTVPANGSCSVAVNVESSVSGLVTNTFQAGDLTGYHGAAFVSNANPASADLTVATFDFNAEINKSFNPINIAPGDVSRLSVSIYNSNTFALENASWTDDLEAVMPGLYIADPPNVTTLGCGASPSVTAVANTTILSLSGATVPAQVGPMVGTCTVQVDVSSITPGNLINTVPEENLSSTGMGGTVSISNTDPASATLQVDAIIAPSITKAFAPSTIWVGQNSRLTIRITNNDLTHDLTQLSLTDVLNDPAPHNVVLATTINPSLTGCGGSASLTAVSGSSTLTLSNAQIAANTTCQIQVNVTSYTQGEYTNDIPVNAIQNKQGVSNISPAQANLNVQSVGIGKAFSPTTIQAGQLSTLTITLRNPTGSAYTGVSIADVMPGNDLILTGTPATTCGSGVAAITTTNRANDTIQLTGGTVPSGSVTTPGTCTITVSVTTADTALTASHVNDIPAGSLSTDVPGITNTLPASATLNVQALSIGILKTFSPTSFQAGGTSVVRVTLQNRTSSIIHVTQLIDNLPNGLVPDPATASTTCANGQAVAVAGPPNTLTLSGLDASGAAIPPGTVAVPGTCYFQVTVTAASSGTYTNTILANSIQTVEGLTNLDPESRSITVYATGLGLTGDKTFQDTPIIAGGNSRLRIRLYAPADMAITNLTVTDNLPAGVTVSNSSPATNTCNGSLSAPTGSGTIELTGGSIAQGGSCTIVVYVTSSTSGVHTNTIFAASQISNDEGQRPPNDLTANLTVSNLTMSKAFYPNTVMPGGRSTLTITFRNTNALPLVNFGGTDNLNTMGGTNFTIASPANATTTCPGGSVTATPGQQLITLSNGTVPGQVSGVPGICTVSVDVIASSSISPLPVTRTNTIYRNNVIGTIQGTGTTIRPVANATADLTVTSLTLGVVKGFDPLTVFGGSSSTMSVQLINPNNAYLTGISFTDTMPAGMYIANPPNFNTGTCGGTITGTPGANTFAFSGGTLAPSKRCTLTLSVTMNVNGNRTNIIPAGGVTSFNGASNAQAAQASLTNLPGASISKYFTPPEMILGETSLLTIQVKNTGNIPLSNLGLTDTLPAGLFIASTPAATNACGGILTANPGETTITLGAGSIIAGPDTTCDIVVPVQANAAGVFTNTIARNTLITSEGATNTDPAEDILTVRASPAMQLVKTLNTSASDPAPYLEGDNLVYNLVVTNTGDIDLTNVTIADPGLVFGTCTPAQPATLAPAATMTCQGTHVVTAGEETAGTYTNTATADSDQTDPVTDSVTVPLNQSNILLIDKVITTAAPYELGHTLFYTITATNSGVTTLNNVTISDPGVTLGTCNPVQPATLLPGASMVCPASHMVNQADVDAGSFSNTATADSNETDPVSDTVSVTITDNARLELYKQVTSTGPYNTIGKRITYDISAVNTGDKTLTNVVITDPGVGVTLQTCTPPQPATLTTGQILSCTAYHDVTAGDITAGGYSNTAFADSDQTSPVSSTAQVVTQTPTIDLIKTSTLDMGGNGRADAGDVIYYTFTVTNTGEVTLTNISLIDIVGGVTLSGGPIASLAPGVSDSTTFIGFYVLTQADVNAGSFTNIASATGSPPVGSPVSDVDDDTRPLPAVRAINLVKTGTLDLGTNGQADAGDTISYAFTVTNTGNVTLTNITVTDTVGGVTISGGPIASLAPGASDSATFTGSYTLTQADVDAGSFTNTATATGTPPSGANPTGADDDSQTLPPLPSIELVKTGTLNLGANARADAGDTITYTFTVTNTGNVTLSNVTISDPDSVISGGPISLAPGASDSTTFTGTHTLTQADVDAGTFTNIATVSGNPPSGDPVTDTDDDTKAFTPQPSIELQKTGTLNLGANSRADAGDTITYVFTVTNTGNVTLTNVTVSDTIGGVTVSGGPIASLAPGAVDSTTFTGSYTLTQADVNSGSFANTATATGTPPVGDDVSDPDDDTQTLPSDASINLVKTGTLNMGANGRADAGDTITYAFTVTNTGNVTLSNVTVADTVGGVTVSGGPIASLAPGAVDNTTFTGSYTLTQVDVNSGSFTNTATATGTPPVGDDVSDPDDDTQSLPAVPSIELVKTGTLNMGANGRADAGDTISYAFTVTNTGNVTLSNVTVTDTVGGVTISGGPIASLAPGAINSTTFTGSYTLTQADVNSGSFTNTATATGTPPVGDDVSDPDDDTQTLPAVPSIDLIKTGTLNMGADGRADAGDTISYAFTVTNTGNVTLSNVTVTDTVGGVTISGGPIASLAPGAINSTTFTGSYTLTQADVNSGSFTNTATATGTPPSGPAVSDSDDDSQTLTPVPSVDLQKTGTLNDGGNGRADAGDTITYTFTVTNTGNVTLTNVTVSEDFGGIILTGSPIASLAPGAVDSTSYTGSYTLTQADVDAGSFTNRAIVTGTPPFGANVTDDDDDVQTLAADPSIELIKTGLVDSTVVLPVGVVDPGDVINYTFTVTNTGNVTLTNVTVTDTVGGVTISGGPIASLAPGVSDNTTFTGSYTLTQPDVDAAIFTNTATATGTPPVGDAVSDDDDDTRNLGDEPSIGIAKRLVSAPVEVSPGTWDVTFAYLVRNYGNVTLTSVQVVDDLAAAFPGAVSVVLQSIESNDFSVSSTYDGVTDTAMLDGSDSLAFQEQGAITVVVRVIPVDGGPYNNTAIASGQPPTGDPVDDNSQDGTDPDPDDDHDPTNNDDPTPVDFGPNMFDPPFGQKTFDDRGFPLLRWTMVWVNNSNIVNILARVSDPIPVGSTYEAAGLASGTGVPLTAPPLSTDVGVSCTAGPGLLTTTTWCYYEGPTPEYIRGRIVWEGSLGPDLGVTNPALAQNALTIAFNMRVNDGVQEINNLATIGVDRDGDGVISGANEEVVASASEIWSDWPGLLPRTGFAPGRASDMSMEPAVAYQDLGGLILEIPSLGVYAPILGVPIKHGLWNLDWLGDNVGYLENTAFPTWKGNSALTAHNYNVRGEPGLFAELGTLRWGAEIIVHGWGRKYVYEVRSVQNWVKPDDTSVITHEEYPWLTLITCRSYDEKSDSYRWRTAVRAVQVRIE